MAGAASQGRLLFNREGPLYAEVYCKGDLQPWFWIEPTLRKFLVLDILRGCPDRNVRVVCSRYCVRRSTPFSIAKILELLL